MAAKARWGIILLLIAGFIFVLSMFMTMFMSMIRPGGLDVASYYGDKIGIIDITGPIYDSEPAIRQLRSFKNDGSIGAILLRIDSPGGGVAASQEIYEEVTKVRESGKVIVVSMGSVAASGGYYIALGAEKIMANPGTVTGSIGVIADFMQTYELMDKLGLKSSTIKSGKFKDSGSPFRDMTDDERKYFQGMVDNLFSQFVETISKERSMPRENVLELADGRVFTGEQAVACGLIDTLGNYEDAVILACDLAGLDHNARRIKERRESLRLIDLLFGDLEEALARISRSFYVAYIMK